MSKLSQLWNNNAGKILGGVAGVPGLVAGALFDAKRNQFRRNRSYIQEAYESARQKQTTHEGDVRQATAEGLNARGLGTTGAVSRNPSRIAAAMASGGISALANLPPSSTIGGRVQTETNRELGLERHDLEAAKERALNENKAEYINDLIKTGANAAQNALAFSGAGADLNSIASLNQQSRIQTAMQPTGINNPNNVWGGVDLLSPVHPAGGGGGRTFNGAGLYNADFHL